MKVPCSTSNLGSGYDVFGMALSLYLCVDVQAIFFKFFFFLMMMKHFFFILSLIVEKN